MDWTINMLNLLLLRVYIYMAHTYIGSSYHSPYIPMCICTDICLFLYININNCILIVLYNTLHNHIDKISAIHKYKVYLNSDRVLLSITMNGYTYIRCMYLYIYIYIFLSLIYTYISFYVFGQIIYLYSHGVYIPVNLSTETLYMNSFIESLHVNLDLNVFTLNE